MNSSGTHVLQSLIESMNHNDYPLVFANCQKNDIIKMSLVNLFKFI